MTFEQQVKLLRPEFFEKKCYTCIHRRTVPGDTHSSCASKTALVKLAEHGVKQGWAYFPFNFDPIWVDACDSHQMKNKTFTEEGESLAKEYIAYLIQKVNALKNENKREAMESAIMILTKLNAAIGEEKRPPTKEEWEVMLNKLYQI